MLSKVIGPLGELPEGWKLARLEDIATKIGSGSTPRGGESAYVNTRTNFAFVRNQNVFDYLFNEKDIKFITDEDARKLKGVHLEESDLLLVARLPEYIEFGEVAIRIDQPYKVDPAGLSTLGSYQELASRGIVSPDVLDIYFYCESLLRSALTAEIELARSEGVEIRICLKQARPGSIEILFGIVMGGTATAAFTFLKNYPKYSDGFERLKQDLTKRWTSKNKESENGMIVMDVSFRQQLNDKNRH